MSAEDVSGARILALEPWNGGSHAQFLEQWREHSRHSVEVVGLSPHHWRWRMRSAAWQLARELESASPPDVLFVSDYLDLPSFLGSMPPSWGDVPTVAYFHENQATYPLGPNSAPSDRERDGHLAWTNLVTALRADFIVFNSAFHRDEFRTGFLELLERWPKPNPRTELGAKLAEAHVVSPGVRLDEIPLGPGALHEAPLRVLFNQRWEYDKDPGWLLRAFERASDAGLEFELVLLGSRPDPLPTELAGALERLASKVRSTEFVTERASYAAALGECDLVVSAARHEFFGIAVLEALAAGCTPLLPQRLAYPEVVTEPAGFYSNEAEFDAAFRAACEAPAALRSPELRRRRRALAEPYDAPRTAEALDALCAELRSSRD